jgi:hypothetical protein
MGKGKMSDNIEQGAQEIVDLMDQGKREEVAERLQADWYHMMNEAGGAQEFNRLLTEIQKGDKPGGVDLMINDADRDGRFEVTLRETDDYWVFSAIEDYPVIGTSAQMAESDSVMSRQVTNAQDKHYEGKFVEQRRD